jgi:alpha-mannosidase
MNLYPKNLLLILVCTLLVVTPSIQAYDLSKEQVCYEVAGAHLDDQWNWTLGGTLGYLIPGTLHKNFAYLAQYPEYKFNFEGAFRYWTAKNFGGAQPASGTDYKAHDYDTLRAT